MRPRLTAWVVASTARLGEKAPATVEPMHSSSDSSTSRRRPRRSAAAPRAMARNPPIRAHDRAAPWAVALLPNSSAANVIDWPSSVPW